MSDSSSPPLDSGEKRAPAPRAGDLLTLGLAAAVATGWLNALVLAVAHHGFDRLVWVPRGFWWMSPIAYGVVLVPGTIVLALLALTIRRDLIVSFAVFAIATTAVFGLLLPVTIVSRSAALILSAGIGVVASRSVMRHPRRWVRWSRGLAALGLFFTPLGAITDSRDRSRAPSRVGTVQPTPPNVLVIVMDLVRASNVTINHPDLPTTPLLAARGREGVVFEWAFSTAPWTLPSHASMFTGLYPRQQAGDWTHPLQKEARTLAEVLRDRGYATGAFVANLHYTGWDSGLRQGFDRYEDYTTDWLQVIRCSPLTQTALFTALLDAKSVSDVLSAFRRPNLSIVRQHTFRAKLAGEVTGDFLAWQEGVKGGPFFGFLNLMDAHLPYYDPEPVRSRYPPDHRDLRGYTGAIGFIDTQLGALLSVLGERGVLDNTIVVVTADHGELFDQHGLSGHANSLYLDVLHVPLLIRFPRTVPAGVRVNSPVSLRDLAATILDLSGTSDSLPGKSLRRAWEEPSGVVSPVLAEITRIINADPALPASSGDMRTAFDDSLHYILHEGTGTESLFAYRNDPLELRNLAEGDSVADRVRQWRERLAVILREAGYAAPNGVPVRK